MESNEPKKNRVSFSQYSTYLKCPHKWYLDYVKNLREKEDNINTTFGTAIHHAFQTYLDALYKQSVTVADSLDVKKIFQTIALAIGLFGGIFGLLFGFLLSNVVDQIPFNTAALPTIKTFPVNYNPKFYLIGIVFSLLTTYLAGLFPARKASKIDPVNIIRGK